MQAGVVLVLSRWQTLNEYFDEVNHHLDSQICFDRHLGGNYYFTVGNDVMKVDDR